MSCAGVGAKPREYVEAQFAKFEDYARFLGKRILPQPAQLQGVNAQARYLNWKSEQEQDERRKQKHYKPLVHFNVDERKLKSLQKMLRKPATDVLLDRCWEFSREFLQQQGVWALVEDAYEDRVA